VILKVFKNLRRKDNPLLQFSAFLLPVDCRADASKFLKPLLSHAKGFPPFRRLEILLRKLRFYSEIMECYLDVFALTQAQVNKPTYGILITFAASFF